MRVLLFSPVPGRDVASGDVSFTRTLVEHPPRGVDYETYDTALASGRLVAFGRASPDRRPIDWRARIQDRLWAAPLVPLNYARARGPLFVEPVWVTAVDSGRYDVIHVHYFNVRVLSPHPPIVISGAGPTPDYYRLKRGYSSRRLTVGSAFDRAVGITLGVNMNSFYLPQATRVVALTELMKDWYTRRGIAVSRIDRAPLYVARRAAAVNRVVGATIGFVAYDFLAKGGDILIDAFRLVRQKRPNARLVIVGADAATAARWDGTGITWLPPTSREDLLTRVLPSFDVLALPTRFEGVISVLEALSLGVPVVTSDRLSMPEILGYGKAGVISPFGDIQALSDSLLRILDPDTNRDFSRRGLEWYAEQHSPEVAHPRLLKIYDAAITAPSPSTR